jgi:hypothetical protein
MTQTIIDSLHKAAQANRDDPFRTGNIIHLPSKGKLIATGDLHGHCRNFERIKTFADLENNPDTHVMLQEIIHGGPQNAQGGCLSYKLIFDVARYKLQFPDRVHIIMGNHDLAFVYDNEVIKNGMEMNRSIKAALDYEFRHESDDIVKAINRFLFSQPLALRCENKIWLSHSLPANRFADQFDMGIFNRPIQQTDAVRPGSVYLLIWGRKHNQELLDKMAELFDADIFVLGHQAQMEGWSQEGENLIIIASDHNHGCLLPIDLSKTYTTTELTDLILPLNSIA